LTNLYIGANLLDMPGNVNEKRDAGNFAGGGPFFESLYWRRKKQDVRIALFLLLR